MKIFVWRICISLLVAGLAAGAVAEAEQAPVNHAKITADFSSLLTLLDAQGALDAGQLAERLPLAVCQAIDPGAVILDAAAAERRREEESGIFYGIGVKLEIRDQRPRVLQALPDGPAAAAGLPAGAIIEKIDGADTLNLPLADVVARLHGPQGQPVTLAYRLPPAGNQAAPPTNIPPPAAELPDAGGGRDADPGKPAPPAAPESHTLQLTRSLMHMPMTGTTEEWPMQLAYMKINGIYDGSGEYSVRQLQEWATQNVAGVILDLRGADGADLPSVAEISSLLSTNGQPLFRVLAGRNRAAVTHSANHAHTLPMPVMALIDADTRGAAAWLAAVLRNCRGAMLIGSPCPQDLAVRTPVPLPDGRVLFIATQKIELLPAAATPTTLMPDVQIPAGASLPAPSAEEKPDADIFKEITDQERQERALTERIGRDAALRRAADILLGLKALGIHAR